MHKYRPNIFPNNTGYIDTQDIIQFQNNLNKPQQKALEKLGIFDTQMNLNNFGNMQINQNIKPGVMNMLLPSIAKSIQDNGEEQGNDNT